jgi:hypothetical protein
MCKVKGEREAFVTMIFRTGSIRSHIHNYTAVKVNRYYTSVLLLFQMWHLFFEDELCQLQINMEFRIYGKTQFPTLCYQQFLAIEQRNLCNVGTITILNKLILLLHSICTRFIFGFAVIIRATKSECKAQTLSRTHVYLWPTTRQSDV